MNRPGTLCIRADTGEKIGVGHVMRCLALAQAWQDRGGEVVLVSQNLPDALRHRLESEHISLRDGIPATTAFVVLDGYHFKPADHQTIKQTGHKLMIVDDLADSDLSAADLVLNHNAYASPTMYPGQRSLCGSRFTLLRREFTSRTPKVIPDTEARSVLITMGGSDPRNDTLAVLNQLTPFTGLRKIVLAGAANPHVKSLRAIPNVELHVNPPDVPAIMQQADLAITAAGSTCWELAALGVPMLVKVIADNQAGIAAFLTAHKAAQTFTLDSLQKMSAQADLRRRLAQNARELVDGRGAARVAESLMAHPLSLRRAVQDDAKQLLDWANDPVTRQASFNAEPIPWETHVGWFNRRLEDENCAFFIATDGEHDLGTVRFDRREPDVTEISFSLAPDARGRGLGSKLIRFASFTVFDAGFCGEVRGWVKDTNVPSLRGFERAGFQERQRAVQHGTESVEFTTTAANLAISPSP